MECEEGIRLEIPHVNTKIEKLFANDNRSDLKIIYRDEAVYNLTKAYLRIQSKYFREKVDMKSREIRIDNVDFKAKDFQIVLKCLYGIKSVVPRHEALTFWKIAKYLEIQSLTDKLEQFILKHFEEFNFFELFRISQDYSVDNFFETCMRILQQNNFSMLKHNKSELLRLPVDQFKCLIINHNNVKKRGRTDISYIQINELIKAYSKNQPNPQQTYLALKTELISPANLSSMEYQLIFHGDVLSQVAFSDPRTIKTSSSFGNIQDPAASTFSRNLSLTHTSKDFATTFSQNVLMRKRAGQLEEENEKLRRTIGQMGNFMMESRVATVEYKKQLDQLKNLETKRESLIQSLIARLVRLEQDSAKKEEIIKKQEANIMELKTQMQNIRTQGNQSLNFSVSKPKEQEDILVMSKVLPGDYFKDIMKPPESNKSSTNVGTPSKDQLRTKSKQKKKNTDKNYTPPRSPRDQQIDQEIQHMPEQIDEHVEKQYVCDSKILTKQHHEWLLSVVQEDSFKKTNLELLYRAKNGNNIQQFFDRVSGSNNLLILISIFDHKVIGGFISVPIVNQGILNDPNAVIFSVTDRRCFKTTNPKCIEIASNGFIVKFGRDLMITDDCLKQEERNECNWPSSFQSDDKLKNSASWLAGHKNFDIEELEVFQVVQEQIQMVM